MGFSILSKDLIENNESIEKIIKDIFSSDKVHVDINMNLNSEYPDVLHMILKNYFPDTNRCCCFRYIFKNSHSIINYLKHDYGRVFPIIDYDIIKSYSKKIKESKDSITISFGRGIIKHLDKAVDVIKRMNDGYKKIEKTNKSLTKVLLNDGSRKQIPIYKDCKTKKEFIFDPSYDDVDINSAIAFFDFYEIGPLTWTVDKSTGIAICNMGLFDSELLECEYEKSKLAEFLESDEFLEELRVDKSIKKEIEKDKVRKFLSSSRPLSKDLSFDSNNYNEKSSIKDEELTDSKSSSITPPQTPKTNNITSSQIPKSNIISSPIVSKPIVTSPYTPVSNEEKKVSNTIISETDIKNYKLNSKKLNLEQKIRRIIMGGKRIPYLVGHPGVGKTQVVKSIYKEFLALNMATMDPDEFKGKPYIIAGEKNIVKNGEDYKVISANSGTAIAEPSWHVQLIEMSNRCYERNERCILFLDEFDKLIPQMQVYINGVVDDPRTIGQWVIPDNVDIILAGNTDEYSDASFNISGEVESRLAKLIVNVSVADWLRWASKNDIDPIVRAYISNYPSKLIEDVLDKDGKQDNSLSLNPRSWDQKISKELKIYREQNLFPYLDPYMDKNNKEAFIAFMNFYNEIGIEDILAGNFPSNISDLSHDQLQAIINSLIPLSTTEDELINSMKFIKKTNLSEYQSFFEKIWLDIYNSDEDINKLRLAQNEVNAKSLIFGKRFK